MIKSCVSSTDNVDLIGLVGMILICILGHGLTLGGRVSTKFQKYIAS